MDFALRDGQLRGGPVGDDDEREGAHPLCVQYTFHRFAASIEVPLGDVLERVEHARLNIIGDEVDVVA